MTEHGLSDRARTLLKLLVERYIREGQPVGSRALSREVSMQVSAATVRNVMSDLEEMGLLRSPHTSAGRVPTVSGYRLFVDTLLTIRDLSAEEMQTMEASIVSEHGTGGLLKAASDTLSSLTHLAGVVMVPRHDDLVLRQVEFLPLSDQRVLAILVVNEHEVQNRVIHVERDYEEPELQRLGNYLTREFSGLALHQVRQRLVAEVESLQPADGALLPAAVELGGRALEGLDEDVDYVLAGQTNLMDFAELSDVRKLRGMFETLAHKREVLSLLEKCLDAQDTQIFIGDESGFEVLGDYSVVTAPYESGGRILGVLGVIGPTRMPYSKVIPIVDVTAKLLGLALNSAR